MRTSLKPCTVAVHQPGYHRHLYYFAKMMAADVFVSLDNVQFAPRDWQNRQQFVYAGMRRWLSVPVNSGREPIRDKRITDQEALRRHWTTIGTVYRHTPYFHIYQGRLEEIYQAGWEHLSELCDALTEVVRDELGITTPYLHSSHLLGAPTASKGELLADVALKAAQCVAPGADQVTYLACAAPMRPEHYLQRPSVADPQITERQLMEARGVRVGVFAYRHPVYQQVQFPIGRPFEAELSAFDLLFNHGPKARQIMADALVRQE